MEIFSALLALCAGNSPITGVFPSQRPVTRSSDVFFDLRLNKRLSKHSWVWWFEKPSRSVWRHRNGSQKNTLTKPPTWMETHRQTQARTITHTHTDIYRHTHTTHNPPKTCTHERTLNQHKMINFVNWWSNVSRLAWLIPWKSSFALIHQDFVN